MAIGVNANNYNSYRDTMKNYFADEEDKEVSDKPPIDFGTTPISDKKDKSVSVQDFLNLMVAQLKNQDFTNPVDDTQYVTQLAQFATMQQMEELAAYSKQNYVTSLIGKDVTVAKMSVTGDVNKQEGIIEKISLVNNEYKVYVNKKPYSLEEIMQIHTNREPPKTDEEKAAEEAAKKAEEEAKKEEEERVKAFGQTMDNIDDSLRNLNNSLNNMNKPKDPVPDPAAFAWDPITDGIL